MLFSIITPTFNAADTIGRTLESVASQTFHDYEHIVIDGDSSDSTMSIVENCDNDRLMAFSDKDRGIYDAMNKGMTEAQGDYLIFLNAGDTFHCPDTLRHIAAAIHNNNDADIVYGQTDIVDINGRYLGPRHLRAPEVLTLDSLREGMTVCHQALAVSSQIAQMYNLEYRYSADYEWLIICLQHARKCVYLPETLTDYLSEGVTTRHHMASLLERYKIMCTYYGTGPTILNHVKFLFRYLGRRHKSANKQ